MTADQDKTNQQTKDLLKAAILMKATSVSDDSYCFPQHEAMSIDIRDEGEDMDDSDQKSTGEEERYRKKKELNRLAAQRSRERRRQLIKQLEQEVKDLENCNDTLTTEIKSMRSEIKQLDHMLHSHSCKMVQ